MNNFLDGKKSHVLRKNNSVQKIVNDRLLKTLVSAFPYGIVWVDVPSLSVVSGVVNTKSWQCTIYRNCLDRLETDHFGGCLSLNIKQHSAGNEIARSNHEHVVDQKLQS